MLKADIMGSQEKKWICIVNKGFIVAILVLINRREKRKVIYIYVK
jgi:hypothetical protein